MDLPHALRAALDRLFEGVRAGDLARIADAQSTTYRQRADHGLDRLLVDSELAAIAYAAWRLPATYAACATALGELARRVPDFDPHSHLDLGSGPGTALHAADSVFGETSRRVAVEGSEPFRTLAARLEAEVGGVGEAAVDAASADARPGRAVPIDAGPRDADASRTRWLAADLAAPDALDGAAGLAPETLTIGAPPAAHTDARGFDLVTLAYVTGELPAASRGGLIDRAWALTGTAFVLVEPGTSAGYARLLQARDRLIAQGAHVVAPCPHAQTCPLGADDWCHFSVRVARSRVHRAVKSADLGWEDEKFAYLAVTRRPTERAVGRILRRPTVGKAEALLAVCGDDGRSRVVTVPRRDRAAYRLAKKLRWGDALPEALLVRDAGADEAP